jgi:hypothetical protein
MAKKYATIGRKENIMKTRKMEAGEIAQGTLIQ